LVGKVMLHDGAIVRACFSPDNRRVLTVSRDQTARVWDAATGDPVGEPLRHREPLLSGEFSADGQWVLTVARDNVVRVWDVRSGQLALEPWGHEGIVRHAEFSPDQRWIVTASDDGTARLWDIAPASVPVPEWLPELAEAVGGQRRDEKGAMHWVKAASLIRLRDQLSNARPDADDYARWARWFFADRDTRTISAGSPVTLPDYVQQRIDEGRTISLREALRLQPTNAIAMDRLNRRIRFRQEAPESGRTAEPRPSQSPQNLEASDQNTGLKPGLK
jgi:WD40 repeat protein